VTDTYSAMVALYPDEATKDMIARLTAETEGKYNPDDLHCTLVFLGDEFPDDGFKNSRIVNVLSEYADLALPMYAEVSAQTMFGPDYSVLLVDGKGIAELYTDVSRALDYMGVYNASEHGYCAHISIASCACEDIGALQMPLVFDKMALVIGPNHYQIG
jgi:2'-5' RNA ligase